MSTASEKMRDGGRFSAMNRSLRCSMIQTTTACSLSKAMTFIAFSDLIYSIGSNSWTL